MVNICLLYTSVAVAFVIPKESDSLEDREVAHLQEKAIMALVDSQIGNFGPVSYTHLDVYKRQARRWMRQPILIL